MAFWTVVAAFGYLLAGAYLWRLVFLRDLSTSEQSNCRTDEELETLREDQRFLLAGEQSGDLAVLLCRAVFIVAWPFFVLYGFINARVLGN